MIFIHRKGAERAEVLFLFALLCDLCAAAVIIIFSRKAVSAV
jgi:hypothetical protein